MSDLHSQTVPYVAETMLPEVAPPSGETGALGWLRANLFSSIGNAISTILAIAVVAFLLYEYLPWFLNAVWNAESLRECRDILSARGDATGACFAIFKERGHQFLFGFYPPDQFWRPILALILFLAACAPVLGEGRVRRFWPLAAAYPLVAYYLIWGGSIWGILAFLVGPAAAYAVFALARPATGGAWAALIAAATAILYWIFLAGPLTSELNQAFGYVGLRSVSSSRLGGALLAMIIGVTGIVFSFPLGILLALGRQSNLFAVKAICVGFIEFIRGVPLITLLFVASSLLNYFLPPGVTFDLILRVVIMVTLFAAAYMAEVIRGGLAAIPRGQYEAAQSLGLPYWDSMRLIILPQALKVAIPGIVGTFIGLFKDTTLVSIISLFDILGIRQPITSDQTWNGIIWEPLVFAAVFFFICCFAMSRYSMYMERKLDTGHRS